MRIALDPAAARTCFAWQLDRCPDHAPRDDFWPEGQPIECEQMLVGNVPLGAACRLREECAGAERWAATCDRSRACPGVCVELPALGEPCEWPLLCRWPLLFGSGGTCVAGAEGDECLDWRDCWPPLLCATDAGGAHACRAPPGEGERCVEYCTAGLYCLEEVCVRPAPPGARCDDRPCADGLRCEGGQCARIVAPGDECDESTRVCPTGLSCSDGRCAPLPAAGEACDDARPCVEGQCVTGVCTPAEPGSLCEPSSLFGECDGYCAPSVERCQPPVSEGGSCAGSEQCVEGLVCVANVCVRCGSP